MVAAFRKGSLACFASTATSPSTTWKMSANRRVKKRRMLRTAQAGNRPRKKKKRKRGKKGRPKDEVPVSVCGAQRRFEACKAGETASPENRHAPEAARHLRPLRERRNTPGAGPSGTQKKMRKRRRKQKGKKSPISIRTQQSQKHPDQWNVTGRRSIEQRDVDHAVRHCGDGVGESERRKVVLVSILLFLHMQRRVKPIVPAPPLRPSPPQPRRRSPQPRTPAARTTGGPRSRPR